MRTASMQFAWLSQEEARAYLASAPKMAENYGDRVLMARRAEPRSAEDLRRIEEARQHNAAWRAEREARPR